MTILQPNIPQSGLHLTEVKHLSHPLFQRLRLDFHSHLAEIHDHPVAAMFRLSPLLLTKRGEGEFVLSDCWVLTRDSL